MSIFNLFTLLGGLAMFLYGMDVMGKSLEQTAGSRLRGILGKMTASPLRFLKAWSVATLKRAISVSPMFWMRAFPMMPRRVTELSCSIMCLN